MCDSGTELCSAWLERWRTARKAHRCIGCGETIKAGHRYHYGSGVFDHRGFAVKHCARCWAMWKAIAADRQGEAIAFDLACGEIWRDPPPEIAALAFALPGEVSP